MRNPYQVLGISPHAGPDEIKAAYRRLVKTCHPDAGRQGPDQRERFHELTAAYDLLRRKSSSGDRNSSDARRHAARAARAEKDATTRPRSRPKAETKPGAKPEPEKPSAKPKAAAETHSSASPEAEPAAEKKQPVFSDFLSNLKNAGKRAFSTGGLDHAYEISIPFMDAVNGTKRRLSLQNGKSLEVHIPAGVEDRQQIRLRGQGGTGTAALPGRESGDALVTVSVAPHPVFRREGADVHIDAAVSLPEAVLGSKIDVPTVDGNVSLSVPAGSNTGTVLRLKGKGLPYPPGKRRLGRGDQYVTLKLMLPPKPDDALQDFAATWADGLKHRPRSA